MSESRLYGAHPANSCPAAHAGETVTGALDLRSLVANGEPTLRARMLDGRRLRLRAFLTPMLERDPERVLISEYSVLPCQICGGVHDPGAQMFVEPRTPPDQRIPLHQPIVVTGTLTVREESSGTLQVYLLDGVFSEPASALPLEARRSRNARADSARTNKAQSTVVVGPTQRTGRSHGNGIDLYEQRAPAKE